MQNRAELLRANQRYQDELNIATRELEIKTAKLKKAKEDVPVLSREVAELERKLHADAELEKVLEEKKRLLETAKKDLQLEHEVTRLSLEMKRIHTEQTRATQNQGAALKDAGVSGVHHNRW